MTRSRNFYDERAPFVGTTVTEIAVLSGRLIASDDLRLDSAPYFHISPPSSINYGAGLDEWTRLYAERAQTAYAFVGNTCPRITGRADGSLVVVSPGFDQETEAPVLIDDENVVANICTDHWAVMLADYDHWLSRGGPAAEIANEPYRLQKFSVIDVTPGLYRWTVFSNDDTFELDGEGRVEYARLELVQAY
jgi:hypothetical protein